MRRRQVRGQRRRVPHRPSCSRCRSCRGATGSSTTTVVCRSRRSRAAAVGACRPATSPAGRPWPVLVVPRSAGRPRLASVVLPSTLPMTVILRSGLANSSARRRSAYCGANGWLQTIADCAWPATARRPLARGVVAEVREVAGVAVRGRRAHVRRPVALHELHVREGAVAVDVHLLEAVVVVAVARPRVVRVVVADDVAASRVVEEDGLVHEARDVVLDEVVGRAAREHDAVVVLPEAVAVRVVDVAVAHDAAVRAGEPDGHARTSCRRPARPSPSSTPRSRRRCRPRSARGSRRAARPARARSRCPPTWSPASRPARAARSAPS